ncbi:hypothetical protein MMC07_000660 [Pseudocyphellaria aurata]|nr:hypothetical protein [Pseudocyphellaria aurata]
MTTASSFHDRNPSSVSRPGLSHLYADPPSPHTPRRGISSTYSSPSASYRNEEETLIFEIGARHLSAGFAGENSPRCSLGFGPEEARRVGDYRRWMPGFQDRLVRKRTGYEWGEDHELWRMDVRELDLGLVENQIERTVREVYSKYLLLELKSRRLSLLLPAILPHPLLSTILSTLFVHFHFSSITLLSTPVCCVAAAGCRAGLVVDIGWSETIITATYEYREVRQSRTTRGMKLVTREMGKMLHRQKTISDGLSSELLLGADETADALINDSFERCEEITTRMAWCQKLEGRSQILSVTQDLSQSLRPLSIAENQTSKESKENTPGPTQQDPLMTMPSPFPPYRDIRIPFSHLAQPVESALFATGSSAYELDDQEQPIHNVVFKTLLLLPPDIRSACLSRIIITGGGSNIPGLKSRLLDQLSLLIRDRGWDSVVGKAADERRRRLKEISCNRQRQQQQQLASQPTIATTAGAALTPQLSDPIEEKLRREQQRKDAKPSVVVPDAGVLRGVETLGAWAGGSLLAALKVKGTVDIDKDFFLQHGLAGARRDAEQQQQQPQATSTGMPQQQQQRQSHHGSAVPRAGVVERSAWTLGGWA